MSWPHSVVSQALSQCALAVSLAHAAVSQRCCLRPLVTIQKFVSRLNPYCAQCRQRCRECRSAPTPCRRALLRCIATPGALCRDARPPSCHDINDCIVTHLSSQAARTRSAAHPAHKSTVSWPCWPCHGSVSQGCWPYRGPSTTHPARLCHDTIFCIVTQH